MKAISGNLKYIFYVHKGNSEYLEESVKQAKFKNPFSKIILLGDGTDIGIAKLVKCENMYNYYTYAKEFEKYYVHLSDKEYNYELFCIQRWFIILEYMIKNNIEVGFYQDSDVVLDCNIEEIKYDGKLWCCDCSGHTSAFNIEILKELCEFILSYYKSKDKLKELFEIRSHMKRIKELNKWTNVTDMELISLFIYYNENKVRNIGNKINGGIFGFNINAQDHINAFHMNKYDFIGDKTKIYLFNSKLFVKESVINRFERVFSIHFHSDTKTYIQAFVKYDKLNSLNQLYYFNFNSSKWEKENDTKEKTLIDYKVTKETLMNLQKYNYQHTYGYEAIKEFIMEDDIGLNSLDNNIERITYGKYEKLNLNNKKIIGWGCGNGLNILKQYYKIQFSYLVDADINKIGRQFDNIEILNISNLFCEDKKNVFVIVLSISHYFEIKSFLEVIGLKENTHFMSMESLIGYLSTTIDTGR